MIIFLPFIMQMDSAGDNLCEVRLSMESHWPCWKKMSRDEYKYLHCSEICPSQILSSKPCTIEVLGPHQVLVYIFSRFSLLSFPFKKLALTFGIYGTHPWAETGHSSAWKIVRIRNCTENARHTTKFSGIRWLWIFFIKYITGVILLHQKGKSFRLCVSNFWIFT